MSRPSYHPGRSLPIGVEPYREEALPSYVRRLAADLDVGVGDILRYTGLSHQGGGRMPTGYGLAIEPTALETASTVLRLQPSLLERMVLAGYDGRVLELSSTDVDTGAGVHGIASREWLYSTGSLYCVACLASRRPYWQLAWKMPWLFMCNRHDLFLETHCPTCGGYAGVDANGGHARLIAQHVPVDVCANSTRKARRTMCMHEFGVGVRRPVGSPRLRRTQKLLSTVIAGDAQEIRSGDDVLAPLDFMRELRSLVAMLLGIGEREDLGEVPEACGAAFDAHCQERDYALRTRSPLDCRSRYRRPPRNPVLMGSVLPAAVECLTAATSAEITDQLHTWVGAHAFAIATPRLEEKYGISPRLAHLYDRNVQASHSFASHFQRLETSHGIGLTWRHVPALFWQREFDADLAGYFPHARPEYARRYCSLALVRLLGMRSWPDAAEALGLPHGDYAKGFSQTVDENDLVDFRETLLQIAQRQGRPEHLIDYAARRAALVSLTTIHDRKWSALCRSAGVNQPSDRLTSRNAATWIWCELTQGDVRHSPAARSHSMNREVHIGRVAADYRRRSKTIEKMAPLLISYGAELLRRKGCD